MDARFLLLPETTPSAPARRAGKAAPGPDPVMHIRRYRAGRPVFMAGDAATTIHEVAQGTVMLSRMLTDGRRQIVDIIGPGRLFGFAADGRHDCTAEALTASMVCSLDCAAATASPLINARILRAMGEDIRKLRDLALLLGRKTAIERVASLLAAMAGPGAEADMAISLPVTRAEIADYLGLTVETVSRTLTRLRQSGLIGLEGSETVRLADPAAIRALAEGEAMQAA